MKRLNSTLTTHLQPSRYPATVEFSAIRQQNVKLLALPFLHLS